MTSPARVLPWVLRALWAILPLTAGPALGAALDPHSFPVRTTGSILLWAGWAATLAATLVPSAVALTAFRLSAPAGLSGALAAVVSGQASTVAAAAATASAAAAVAIAFLPETSLFYVNGRSYPNERRLPLRPPGPLLLGPIELAWGLTTLAPVAAVFLLAARQWIAGGVALAVTAPLAFVMARAIHGLSRRWVVFVPAGLVLHDPIALLDPVLFQTKVVESVGPALAGSDSLDLTQGATGLALELILREKVPMTLSKPGTHAGESGGSARLLFTPSRPGLVLQEAADRGLPVSVPG
jgi:hypothetical protein